jgi:hypothetical protein
MTDEGVVISKQYHMVVSLLSSLLASVFVVAGVYFTFKHDIKSNEERSVVNKASIGLLNEKLITIEKSLIGMEKDINSVERSMTEIKSMWGYYMKETFKDSPWARKAE